MLNASSPDPLKYSSDQSEINYFRSKLLHVDQQRDAFKNANTGIKFAAVDRSHSHGIYPNSMGNNYLLQKTAETQFQTHISDFRPLTTRILATATPAFISSLINPSPEVGAWLQESLTELSECPSCAIEDEIDEPTKIAMTKAKKLLEKMARHVIEQPDVYPMQYSSIAIDFRSPYGKNGVLFLVEQDGTGVLFYQTSSSKGRIQTNDATDLLEEGGLRELKRVDIR